MSQICGQLFLSNLLERSKLKGTQISLRINHINGIGLIMTILQPNRQIDFKYEEGSVNEINFKNYSIKNVKKVVKTRLGWRIRPYPYRANLRNWPSPMGNDLRIGSKSFRKAVQRTLEQSAKSAA